ncbi:MULTISPECIES: hypothetical protein [unclassified Pseudomonas]|uniref:hypothetical protein n=1 Tax=unclassified Pseudomonas TaxID=196821 RepID=UPI001B32A3E4|nr:MULTISPECIES: hypothetical protein [unclassified Pseudomonas]MBP5946894.1 hypothetical protein [Pseudomonas sp. P9(2020)]MBZ9565032.1 hypothetical protein [Pseudomonas sp. P116]
MISSASLVVLVYLLISLVGFFFFVSISRKISGRKLTPGRFWVFFAVLLFWVVNQMSVAQNGYLFSYRPSKEVLENDYVIRWIAYISAIAQAFFLPSKEEPKRWFSRK